METFSRKGSHLFSLLFLMSPARPIGSFSFSGGMESFTAEGLVRDKESLQSYLSGLILHSYARTELPLLKRSFLSALQGDFKSLLHWNQVSLALKETREFLLEEEELGAASLRLLKSQNLVPAFLAAECDSLRLGYLSATGVFASALGLLREDLFSLLSAFLWSLVENQVTAAAKTIPLGQNAAQWVLLKLQGGLPKAVETAYKLSDGEIGLSLPLRAILSARHEESPLRMFRS